MAQTTDAQGTTFPLPAYNFRVSVDGQAMNFTQVTGIRLEYENRTYRHGLSAWEGEQIVRYRINKYIPVTLRKGTVKGQAFLRDWLDDESRRPRPMEVSLCDAEGVPVVTWRMGKVIPVKLEAAAFDAGTNEVSVESLEVMAASISLVHH